MANIAELKVGQKVNCTHRKLGGVKKGTITRIKRTKILIHFEGIDGTWNIPASMVTALDEVDTSVQDREERRSNLVGTEFRSSYADSNPLWKVIRSRGRGVYLCRVIDSYDYLGVEEVFTKEKILAILDWDERTNSRDFQKDEWYETLQPGEIIHYDNGFRQFVRCRVVRMDGQNRLMPIGLVDNGQWDTHDLPNRRETGEIYYPYHANKIREQNREDAWQPDFHCCFECPGYTKSDQDPSEMPLIDLELPEMTEEQEEEAKLHRLAYKIVDVINNKGVQNAEDLLSIREKFAKVAEMLREESL